MSLTKVELSEAEIGDLVRQAFGTAARVASVRAATEGKYNAGYYLELAGSGPARSFLKVAPPPTLPVLTYEHDLMRTEIEVMRGLAKAGVQPVPAIQAVDLSRRRVDRDCLFMAWLDGPLFSKVGPSLDLADRVELRRQVGRIAGAAHRIGAPVFGYPGQPRLQAPTWPEAFGLMIAALLDDAVRFDAVLPLPIDEIRVAFERASPLLGEVEAARLTHFDLWDSNVLVRQDADGWAVSGVIDWERAFYGDPLADVVSLTLFDSPPERAALLQGLSDGRGEAAEVSPEDERRLALYRAYLWLIMIVEAGPRGFAGSIRLPTSRAARRLIRDLAMASEAG
ncbi:MAG TPA: aminoglycoside phosphotransferase family protein [Caulobacteraceae bacterium]|jgi:aminoglycoside phosphotransferase (APT) family kinase protein|nr:aminoglycoside phosphotransferase family protein [Caulobacteraceae bacterium]